MKRATKDPQATARELTTSLESVFGPRLRSVLLYGSVARGEAVAGVSDINVLVLLDDVEPPDLAALGPLGRRWAEAGNTAPLVLAWDEWRRAADVFAIEVADMLDAHALLFGADPLDGLAVERAALRLQTERELRGKLIQLREGLIVAAERPADVGALLQRALPSFATYFRAVLRLTGDAAPRDTADALRLGADAAGAEPEPFLRVLRARRDAERLRLGIDDPTVVGYYRGAERLTAFVDALPQETKG